MTEHYLDRLARTINENWNQPALTDLYLTEDYSSQDTSCGNHYTYGEMYREIIRLGEMLSALDLHKGDHIAICAASSAHWAIAYLAIAAYQGVAVTILPSQYSEDIARQIDYSDAKALFTDAELWNELEAQALPQVEHVISMDHWQILRGKEIPISHLPSPISKCQFLHGEPDDLAMICFTSGSTGISKGVMIPNRSISNVALNEVNGFPVSENNNYVSFLPFAHTYGMMTDMLGQLALGKHIHVSQMVGSKQMLTCLRIVKPYAIVTIPAILTQLFAKFKENLPSVLGGKCEQFYIGGSALSQEVTDGMMSMGMPFSMGYGLSETCFLISYVQSNEYRYKSAGKICIGMTARIDDNGEILVKGENVMLGYYKDPEATARKIDKDGWLHTGDRGHLDEDGYLYVEGRLEQDMIVLPNGENIHPEDIERKINALPEVKESIVLARDGKLVAIVVADTDVRRHILRTVNPELPLYSQLYDVEITDTPLQKTEKQTLKRYLYK